MKCCSFINPDSKIWFADSYRLVLVHLITQYEGEEHPVTGGDYGSEPCSIYWSSNGKHQKFFKDSTMPETQDILVSLRDGPDPRPPQGQHYISYTFCVDPGARTVQTGDRSVHIAKSNYSTDDGTIDMRFLAEWIAKFKLHHEYCTAPVEATPPRGFRLIDAKAMKVVDVASQSSYVALSYVWGAESESFKQFKSTTLNIASLREDQGLLRIWDQIPRTIRDGIKLCQRLDWRYLWVDAICIIQDDLNDKMAQIAAMGTIFEGADLVLAAAYGSNADAGLPGIEAGRFKCRALKRFENIHDKVRLVSRPANFEKALSKTTWSSRAWTFQESQLAKMQLTFTASQAYLSCICGKVSEEYSAVESLDSLKDIVSEDPTPRLDGLYPNARLFHVYKYCLEAYSAREIGYPEDVLNAFSAILDNLKRTWNVDFMVGLPESLLSLSLQWEQANTLRRRNCRLQIQRSGETIDCPAPSWSWAGWIGKVCYRVNQDKRENEIIWTLSNRHVRLPTDEATSQILLQGVASTAVFSVGPYDTLRRVHYITDENEKQIGLVMIPDCPYWTSGEQEKPKCEFVALDYVHVELRPAIAGRIDRQDDNDIQVVVKALLVSEPTDGIVYRIGITDIAVEDWQAANPRERLVTLG